MSTQRGKRRTSRQRNEGLSFPLFFFSLLQKRKGGKGKGVREKKEVGTPWGGEGRTVENDDPVGEESSSAGHSHLFKKKKKNEKMKAPWG